MKTIIFLFLLTISCTPQPIDEELEQRSACAMLESAQIVRIGKTHNKGVYNLILNATGTGSLKVYAKCGYWYFQEWQCINLPHNGETADFYCGINEPVEFYAEWYSGQNCTGEICAPGLKITDKKTAPASIRKDKPLSLVPGSFKLEL